MPELIEAVVNKKNLKAAEVQEVHKFLKTMEKNETGRRKYEEVPILPFSAQHLEAAHQTDIKDFTGFKDVHGKPVEPLWNLILRRLIWIGAAHWEFSRPKPTEARLVIKRMWVDSIRAWIKKQETKGT